jgi:hypothetical protein
VNVSVNELRESVLALLLLDWTRRHTRQEEAVTHSRFPIFATFWEKCNFFILFNYSDKEQTLSANVMGNGISMQKSFWAWLDLLGPGNYIGGKMLKIIYHFAKTRPVGQTCSAGVPSQAYPF